MELVTEASDAAQRTCRGWRPRCPPWASPGGQSPCHWVLSQRGRDEGSMSPQEKARASAHLLSPKSGTGQPRPLQQSHCSSTTLGARGDIP